MRKTIISMAVFLFFGCKAHNHDDSETSSTLGSATSNRPEFYHLQTPLGFVFPFYERTKWVFYATQDPVGLASSQASDPSKTQSSPAAFKMTPVGSYPQLVTLELMEKKGAGYIPLGLCLTTASPQRSHNEISVNICAPNDPSQQFSWYAEKRVIEVKAISADKKVQCLDVWREAQTKGWRFGSLLIYYPCANPRPANQEFYVVPAV